MHLAVRRLMDEDFARIVRLGLPEGLERQEAARYESEGFEVAAEAGIFERPVLARLARRPYRDVAFSGRCARLTTTAAPCPGLSSETAEGARRCTQPISARSNAMAATP